MRKHTTAMRGITAAILATIIATMGLATTPNVSAAHNPMLTAPFGVIQCGLCDACVLVPGTAEVGHTTARSEEGLRKLGPDGPHPDECEVDSCNTAHPYVIECFPSLALETAPTLPELWSALVQADESELKQVITDNEMFVHYNSARRALQILGCDGSIVAHMPLTSDQVHALE